MSSVEPMNDVEPIFENHALALTIDACLRILQYRIEDDVSSRVMAVMAKAIERSEKICDEAFGRGDPDSADMVCDDEIVYIEELLGISFVLLQTKIARVISATLALHRDLAELGVLLPGLDDRDALRALGGDYKEAGASLIQFVWDVANYYKHREGWEWEAYGSVPADRQAKKTWESVKKMGIERSSTGNMRTACEFFGFDPYSSFTPLADAVQEWAEALSADVQSTIKTTLGSRYDEAFAEVRAYRPRMRRVGA
jgi:hypothetical protein